MKKKQLLKNIFTVLDKSNIWLSGGLETNKVDAKQKNLLWIMQFVAEWALLTDECLSFSFDVTDQECRWFAYKGDSHKNEKSLILSLHQY